jgi:hypothetical protein
MVTDPDPKLTPAGVVLARRPRTVKMFAISKPHIRMLVLDVMIASF